MTNLLLAVTYIGVTLCFCQSFQGNLLYSPVICLLVISYDSNKSYAFNLFLHLQFARTMNHFILCSFFFYSCTLVKTKW